MENQKIMNELIERSKKAQLAIEDWSQEKTDQLVKAIGKAIFDHAEILSQEAIDETGFGNLPGKIGKHKSVTMANWHYMKDKKSVGVIEVDPINQIVTLAKPMGVVASVTPSTNPTSTPAQNAMIAIKGRNSVIVAPHPNAKKATSHAVEIMQDAIEKLGAPRDLVLVIEEPSLEMTNLLMANADVILATGGFGMVKAAYSSGKPSFGVGQGNVQTYIDETVPNLGVATATIVGNRAMDLGVPCTGDQTVYIPRSMEKEILDSFVENGAYLINDEALVDKIRQQAFIDGRQNLKIIGKTPTQVAEVMELGLDVPEEARVLLVKVDQEGPTEPLAKEILCPMLRYRVYDDFREAIEWGRTNLLMEGAGHTGTIHTSNDENIEIAGERLPVGRLMVNQAGSAASGGPYNNGLNPTLSIGCGSWGNNSISENLSYRHLLNVTKVSRIIPDIVAPTPEEVWAD